MSWKFNPPPGWPPQPEGWQPPPGWTPDPSWPPAPAGWQFWVPAGSDAGASASGSGDIHEEPTEVAGIPPVAGGGQTESPPSAGSAPASPPASPPFSATSGGSFGGTDPAAPSGSGGTFGNPPSSGGGAFGAPSGGGFGSPPGSGGGFGSPPGSGGAFGGAPAGGWQGSPTPPTGTPVFHRWWVFGAVAAVVLLMGCVIGTGVGALTAPNGGDTPTPTPTATADGPGPNDPQPSPSDPGQTQGSGSGELAPGQERSGDGPALVSLNLPPNANHMITVSFEGDGLFQAQLIDSDGDIVQMLASEYGDFTRTPYTATRLVELAIFGIGEAAAVEISEAEGEWSLMLQDIQEAPLWPDVTSGTGASVLRVDPDAVDDQLTLEGTYDGESNFIVWSHTPEEFGSTLLFNEIGDYSGESQRPMEPGTFVMEIQARWDGEWTLEPAD